MLFLLYSRITAANIRESLGAPEYSYYFLLREFLPVFERLGRVQVIADPAAEADPLHAECVARGEACVLIAFTAPQHLPAGLRCPMVPVFAWEFDRIPDEPWGEEARNDWRIPLGECGIAITLSDYALEAARRSLGAEFPLLAVPVPLWERMAPARDLCGDSRTPDDNVIAVDGAVLDTRDYRCSPSALQTLAPRVTHAFGVWAGEEIGLQFHLGAPGVGALGGFYLAEPWGSWSRNAEVWIALPCMAWGRIEIEISARAYGNNVGRVLLAGMNEHYQPLQLGPGLEVRRLVFDLAVPTHMLQIRGMDVEPAPGGRDERTIGIGIAGLRLRRLDPEPLQLPLVLHLRAGGAAPGMLEGFCAAEEWGTWSVSPAPWLLLPRPLAGRVRLRIDAVAHGDNIGRELQLYLGRESRPLQLSEFIELREFEFDLEEPVQVLGFGGIVNTVQSGSDDPRALGIGLRSVEVLEAAEPVPAATRHAPAHVRHLAQLEGVVFTSVLNPRDDRKNWQMLITAFVAAFGERDDVSLVLKMTHHSQSSYLFDLHYHVLQRLPPYRCRVQLLHGYLADDDYARLVRRTDFYVNASKAEGLCIPLMEFMSCGKPALAPWHTSMRDYLDESNSIRVAASTEPCSWPHDERLVLRALQYRVEWSALVEGFRQARSLFAERPAEYRRMGDAARERMRAYCGMERIERELTRFLGPLGDPPAATADGAAP